MLDSKKIAVAAGVLWSFALIGAGASQAFGHDGSGKCVDDGKGNVRCVQEGEYRSTTDKRGNGHVSSRQTQTCPAPQSSQGSNVVCVNRIVIGGKKL
ncbi:hypothetical protein [Streptomyces sp. JNUCC 63]